MATNVNGQTSGKAKPLIERILELSTFSDPRAAELVNEVEEAFIQARQLQESGKAKQAQTRYEITAGASMLLLDLYERTHKNESSEIPPEATEAYKINVLASAYLESITNGKRAPDAVEVLAAEGLNYKVQVRHQAELAKEAEKRARQESERAKIWADKAEVIEAKVGSLDTLCRRRLAEAAERETTYQQEIADINKDLEKERAARKSLEEMAGKQ